VNSLPRNVAVLGAVVAFCAALLAGLVCDSPPLIAAKRAALCAAVVAVLAWVCSRVAVSVMHDGLRRHDEGSSV
jgi:hypothetical protein